MSMRKEAVYLLIIVGLLGYIILQKEDKPTMPAAGLNLRLESPIELYIPQTDSLVSLSGILGAEYTLLVYFTARDCYSCIQEFKMWNRLADDYPKEKLQIIGIYPATEETEVLSSQIAESVQFPLFRDPGNVGFHLQIHQTPTKVLFGPTGVVRFYDGPHQQRHFQKQAYTAISSIVGVPINKSF